MIAVIPARGGSKGLPGKNIKSMCGLPLIAWTIKAAVESGCFEKVIVSTDCSGIADVAIAQGAEIPFLRDESLALDESSTSDVVIDLAQRLHWGHDHVVCLLQPTSPLRGKTHLQESARKFEQSEAASLVSVCQFKLGREWLFPVESDGEVREILDVSRPTRRQDSSMEVYPNGSIYILDIGTLKRYSTFIPPCFTPYIMDQWDSIDIDNQSDFDIASAILSKRLNASCQQN